MFLEGFLHPGTTDIVNSLEVNIWAGSMVISCDINDSLLSVKLPKPKQARELVLLGFRNLPKELKDSVPMLVDELQAEGATEIACEYTIPQDSDIRTLFIVNNQEILAATKKKPRPKNLMKWVVEYVRQWMPVEISEGMVYQGVSYEKKALVYDVSVDEAKYRLNKLRENADAGKKAIIDTLNSRDMRYISDFFYNAKTRLVYRYTGNKTGESITVEIPYSELRKD